MSREKGIGPVVVLAGHLRAHYGRDPALGLTFPCLSCGATIDRTPGSSPRYFGSSLCWRCQDPEHFGFAR